jgi:hypothetical protein
MRQSGPHFELVQVQSQVADVTDMHILMTCLAGKGAVDIAAQGLENL